MSEHTQIFSIFYLKQTIAKIMLYSPSSYVIRGYNAFV